MTQRNIHLLVIDPQNDFCDLPSNYLPSNPLIEGEVQTPQLAVPGAHADMLRLADFIRRGMSGLTGVSITLDSHHRVGIERPAMWMNADGSPMQPFTEVKVEDVRAGKYLPRRFQDTARVLAYLDALQAGGRYVHMVWPAHCEIGTWGHNVHADVRDAYCMWEECELGVVNKVTKGSNPWTEHYSAVMAEVADANDPATQLNLGLLNLLANADLIPVAGEAGSHCVKATVEHIANHFGPAGVSKLVLLEDCISPVGGFEPQYQEFLSDMRARGVQVSTSSAVLGELLVNSRK